MKRALLLIVGATLAALLAAPPPSSGQPRGAPPPAPAPKRGARDGTSDCAACHVEKSWSEVRFNHEKTGFPLGGAHAQVSCRGCHRQDFKTRVPDTCAGCHRDRHASEFGMHCEGCHEDSSWRAVLFFGEGHRRTAFPLTGKHAVIPCQECHGNMRDRTFERAPLTCVNCHRPDFDRAKLTSIDHMANNFTTDCQSCHDTWSFFPARFPAHDKCFELSKGSHRPFRCLQCHSSTTGLMLTGTCMTGTETCNSCHTHDCARADKQHTTVMGYACVNEKCYECHQKDGQ